MANNDLLNTPILWINKYLQDNVEGLTGLSVPFFPSTPSTIEALTQSFPESGTMATWDRLVKMNKRKFPHIKNEQLMYYFYANGDEPILKMVKMQEAVLRLMDRLDESAEEVNDWCSNRRITLDDGNVVDCMFYFHSFKIYQLEETRDIIDFGTARTYGGNKIILDVEYHQMPELTNNDWAPETKIYDQNGNKVKRIV
jgi:hypothetical protein